MTDRQFSHGTAARNAVMSELRSHADPEEDPHEPTQVWIDRDRTPEGVADSLTIILNTGGRRWAHEAGFTTSDHVAEATTDVTDAQLREQLKRAIAFETEQRSEPAPIVKIYTSGSALDDAELPSAMRRQIADQFANRDRLVVETLPQFVDKDRLEELTTDGVALDIAIGVETASDRIRQELINKAITFDCIEQAAATAATQGVGVRTHLLQKPPFLTEAEALEDAIHSVRACADLPACHTVSVSPTNVQRHTLVDELYSHGGYRPPWLWSVLAVLERTHEVDAIVRSDPIGAGSDRGPHNCGACDERVERAIKDYSLRGDPAVFEQVECDCQRTWHAVIDRERAYTQPLAR